MGHNLKVLWRAYKAAFPDSTLKRHDKTISGLNKFEDIRYNGVIAAWSGPPGEVTAYGGIKTPKQYKLVVVEIDALIVDTFKMSSWDPSRFMGTNKAAIEAITRCNPHSEFLTTGRG
jgi:hypothetical protein